MSSPSGTRWHVWIPYNLSDSTGFERWAVHDVTDQAEKRVPAVSFHLGAPFSTSIAYGRFG